jgi:hypothetical protein
MEKNELEILAANIEELRRAVRRNNPLMRQVVSSRLFAILALLLGAALTIFCLGTHFLVRATGSFAQVPGAWKLAFWIYLGLFVVGGGLGKIVVMRKRAAAVQEGSSYFSVLKAAYGGPSFRIMVPALLCMAVSAAFAVWAGHPWYIVPATAVFYAFAAGGLGFVVDRPEYPVSSWFALATALPSLFFFERAPFLWSGAIYGGLFLVYGIVGLAFFKDEGEAR